MDLELKGKVFSVGKATVITEKVTVRNFVLEVVETDGDFEKTQHYPIQLVNKNADKLKPEDSGKMITVKGNLDGRKFTRKDGTEGFILSMSAWYIRFEEAVESEEEVEDDQLPF